MTEPAKKKQGESVKLPPRIQQVLRQVIAPYLARGEPAPTRGEILIAALNLYQASLKREVAGEGVVLGNSDNKAQLPKNTSTGTTETDVLLALSALHKTLTAQSAAINTLLELAAKGQSDHPKTVFDSDTSLEQGSEVVERATGTTHPRKRGPGGTGKGAG